MSSTSKKIGEIQIKIRELEKVQRHLTDLTHKINLLKKEQKDLKSSMIEKDELVKDLEGLSLKGIFYKVLGSKEEQIEKGRQDFLEVYLKLEEVNKAIDSLSFEEKILAEKSGKQRSYEAELEQLIVQHEKELMQSNSKEGARLKEIAKLMDHTKLMIWEIGEAEQAGTLAVRKLEEILHFLRSARNWGRGSSDRWMAYRRQTNIDRAKRSAHQARQQLYVFQRELSDLYAQTPDYAGGLQLDLYQGFLATLFRNMISDFVLQQKIRNTLGNVNSVKDSVILEIHKLTAERNGQQNESKNLEHEKRSLLLTS